MANRDRHGAVFSLAPRQQLQDAWCPEDDWTGLRDRIERRKRQNRLNVRAHRRRKAAGLHHKPGAPAESTLLASSGITARSIIRWDASRSQDSSPLPTASTPRTTSDLACARHVDINPMPSYTTFPLSRDHLISIIELNVFRASLTNIYILGVYSLLCKHDCGYTLNSSEPPLFPWAGQRPPGNIPESLRPTPLQRSTPHEAWIDILPWARMRDNAIVAVAEGRLRNEDFCADVLRGMCGGGEGHCQTGMGASPGGDDDGDGAEALLIVWDNPWEAGGWEVTKGFLRKWGFLLRGAGEDEMVRATNRWRALRGEDPIVWEVE